MTENNKFTRQLVIVIVTGIATVATSVTGAYFSGADGVGDEIDSSREIITLLQDQLRQSRESFGRLEDEMQEIERSIPVLKDITLLPRFQDADQKWLARAFIETGSFSPLVLATLRDNQELGSHVVSLWASARTKPDSATKGILLTVVTSEDSFEELAEEPYEIIVNVYQKGAVEYGAPEEWQDL